MKIGNNTFSVLVNDISGSTVPNLSAADFTLTGKVANDIYTSFGDVVETNSDGIYDISVNLLNRGQGHLQFKTANPDLLITPDFFAVEVFDNSIDDVYRASTLRFIDIGTQSTNQSFRTVSLISKQGDTIEFEVATQEDITGFTDWKSTFVLSTTLPPTGANLVGDASIESVDEGNGLIVVKLDFSLTDTIVPEGVNEITIWGDLQGRKPNSDRITIAEIRLRLRRQFAIG